MRRKPRLKRTKTTLEASKPSTLPDALCSICDRVLWGDYQRLGNGKARHKDCVLGSEEWKLYYHRLTGKDKARLTEFYNYNYGGN